MVKGLQTFRDHFGDYADCFVVIGGVACDEWFGSQGLEFRATQDVDMVLLVDGRRADYLKHFWSFVSDHGYEASGRRDGSSTHYRFVKPRSGDVPGMIELFAAAEIDFDLREGQRIIPIAGEGSIPSLSAILMDPDYFELIRTSAEVREGLPIAGVGALIPLKARAYLDMSERKHGGEPVDSGDLRKHRNDVFLLAATLPGEPGLHLPESVRSDLSDFLDRHPEGSSDWQAIRDSARNVLGAAVPTAVDLISAIRIYFGL